MAKDKIVLAFSGGLDTSVAVPWLKEKYDADIITLTMDLGMVDLESIKSRAMQVGAAKALTVDAKATLVNEIMPPLNITPEELDEGIGRLEEALKKI